MTEPRFLQPRELIPVGRDLWVFDTFQPVAVVIDRQSLALQRIVSWPEVTPSRFRHLAGDGIGIWQQLSDTGSLIRIGPDGVVSATYLGGLDRSAGPTAARDDDPWMLLAAPAGAWSILRPPAENDSAASPQAPPRSPLRESRLDLVDPAGRRRSWSVQGQIQLATVADDALFLKVALDGWQRRDSVVGQPDLPADIDRWQLERETAWLRLPADGTDLPDPIVPGDWLAPQPPRDPIKGSGSVGYRSPWYENQQLLRAESAGGSDWIWGWPMPKTQGGIWRRPVLVTAHDPDTQVERHRIDLGFGCAVAGIADGRSLWLSMARRVAPPLRFPVEVLRIDGVSAEVRSVLGPESVDISGYGWQALPRPIDADSYAEYQLARYADPQHYWKSQDGERHALSDGMRGCLSDLVGDWPNTELRLRFEHQRWPGLQLVHSVRLYDELGRPAPAGPDNLDWTLGEKLDGGLAPPPDDAVDGVLHV